MLGTTAARALGTRNFGGSSLSTSETHDVQLAGQGLASASVAIDSAPFRGVLPLPLSALRSARPVIGNPANYRRAVMLTYEQFRYSFANAVSENEARRLYDAYPVPGSGTPLFQAATANVNPFTEIKVNTRNPDRGPLLLITGEKDHIAPHAIAAASYRKQKRNRAATQIREIPDRGHSLVFDSGWQDIAETALAFMAAWPAPPCSARPASSPRRGCGGAARAARSTT